MIKSLKNINLTNTHKIIISVVGLGILVFLTRKYWIHKKKQEEISKQSIPNENISISKDMFNKNSDRIYCHNPKCNWNWAKKDGGNDLYICHKCFTNNEKFYVNTTKKN